DSARSTIVRSTLSIRSKMNKPVIRIENAETEFKDYRYRTPIKFGGVAVDRVTLLNVNLIVRSPDGKSALGFGSMPLGNVWSFPSKVLSYDQTLEAMKRLSDRIATIVRNCVEYAHPIDLTWT